MSALVRSVFKSLATTTLPVAPRRLSPCRSSFMSSRSVLAIQNRNYAKKNPHFCDSCRSAIKDVPKRIDPDCNLPCERQKPKKKGILYKVKLKIVEGGTNFGTRYNQLKCKVKGEEQAEKKVKDEEEEEEKEPKNLPVPAKQTLPVVEKARGCQVSILGADTAVGQYVALLLKQCPQIKKLRLYQSSNCCCPQFCYNIAQDLHHIDTNCLVQAFSCCCNQDLGLCLQNSDIVLILESGCANVNLPFEKRFMCEAPLVKKYADAIARECPKAMIIVCATPVDCMVPLIAETMKQCGWYDKRKLIGSMAVPEMRASTIAARALSLEPVCTRVPCVGGTEGDALVPLFSKTAFNFEFDRDKLLNKLEENEPELATSPEEECVICVNAKATMQTAPCGHRVVCRRCFVKTIQMAVSQRLLPLRCVICRAKILRLRQAPRLTTSKSWQVSSSSGRSWGVPGSVSSYSVGARSVPASASLYSVTSGESSLSGVSSVSSNSGGNVSNSSSSCSTKLCGGAKCGGACLGAVPRASASAPPRPRQPASNSLRRSQHHSMKARLQEYQVHSYTGGPPPGEPSTGRLPPIREFQREFREGRRESAVAASASTRIRCAQKIVTQLETSPQKKVQHFFRPLKSSNKDDAPKSRDTSKETERIKDNPKAKPKKEDKKQNDENTNKDEKNKKDESIDNRKNEIAERKKEEKLRLKAEKEAKKEAKLLAKEEERQAKLLAKEEERQAKLLAKEEKKKAKKEAKLAAQAEKEKEKTKA